MTISKDAGNLLLYVYNCKNEGTEMKNTTKLLEETGWNKDRLNNAVQYLVESGFVEGQVIKGAGSTKVHSTFIFDIKSSGINIIEAKSDFKQTFGFTVNLGLIQINWGVQES